MSHSFPPLCCGHVPACRPVGFLGACRLHASARTKTLALLLMDCAGVFGLVTREFLPLYTQIQKCCGMNGSLAGVFGLVTRESLPFI